MGDSLPVCSQESTRHRYNRHSALEEAVLPTETEDLRRNDVASVMNEDRVQAYVVGWTHSRY
jgi:hypothetical protein